MKNPQEYAIRIEHIMCGVFNCDRFGVGGLVDADYIRYHPFPAMMATLTYLYGRNMSTYAVSEFFEKYRYYGDWSIDVLLSFESNSKVIGGITCEIDYSNGEEAIQAIIADFFGICKQNLS